MLFGGLRPPSRMGGDHSRGRPPGPPRPVAEVRQTASGVPPGPYDLWRRFAAKYPAAPHARQLLSVTTVSRPSSRSIKPATGRVAGCGLSGHQDRRQATTEASPESVEPQPLSAVGVIWARSSVRGQVTLGRPIQPAADEGRRILPEGKHALRGPRSPGNGRAGRATPGPIPPPGATVAVAPRSPGRPR
jgi:hypothetical protein